MQTFTTPTTVRSLCTTKLSLFISLVSYDMYAESAKTVCKPTFRTMQVWEYRCPMLICNLRHNVICNRNRATFHCVFNGCCVAQWHTHHTTTRQQCRTRSALQRLTQAVAFPPHLRSLTLCPPSKTVPGKSFELAWVPGQRWWHHAYYQYNRRRRRPAYHT